MIGFLAVAGIGPLGHDPSDVRARADELLSRAPFTDGGPGPVRRLLRYLGDAIAGFLGGLFDGVFGAGVLPWIAVALGITLVSWLVWRITRGLTADRSIAQVPAEVVSRSPADWHADADAAQARGELREALRCRYAALVATLLGGGLLEDVPGRTVRELDSELAWAVPGIADDVAAAGERFERVVYGHLEVTDQDLEVVANAARRARAISGRALVGERP